MKKGLALLSIGLLALGGVAQGFNPKRIGLRLINFTPDEFFTVKITDTPAKETEKATMFFDGRLEDQEYIGLKEVNTKRLPLNVTVYERDKKEPTELLIEDVIKEGIRVTPGDLWFLYRDDQGKLQITEVNKQETDYKVHGKNPRLVNFTADEFYTVQVIDSSNKKVMLFDGRLEDQMYIELKTINKMMLPLHVTVWEPNKDEPTELLIKDVVSEGIKVERDDLWTLYRDDEGELQITEVNRQKGK